ncbi:MAG: hypothetical protein ACI8ZB_001240 [Desulforhopalus sp.]|jgi:hypothetical protein
MICGCVWKAGKCYCLKLLGHTKSPGEWLEENLISLDRDADLEDVVILATHLIIDFQSQLKEIAYNYDWNHCFGVERFEYIFSIFFRKPLFPLRKRGDPRRVMNFLVLRNVH